MNDHNKPTTSYDVSPEDVHGPWYRGITRYQWLVLVIASLGWVFDVFEGQLFVSCMEPAMDALVTPSDRGNLPVYRNIILGAFLVGGALGGVLFGVLSDRIGRKRAMVYTILMYSFFTCFSAFSQTWWQLAGFRFLVAMGVGGEWAVASALVAEVFPKRARAWSQSIFHASSVLGTYLAVFARLFVIANPNLGFEVTLFGETWHVTNWRLAFLMGIIPSLLIIWIRMSLKESERWLQSQGSGQPVGGRLGSLFESAHLRSTLVGVGLATVGMATFWGTFIFGKNVLLELRKNEIVSTLPPDASQEEKKALLEANRPVTGRADMLGMLLVTTGGGFGLLFFGPLSERLGRRGAFLFYHLGAVAAAMVLFRFTYAESTLYFLLPVFGFLTLGIHAGYAVYFPELYPTHLRSTGAGFCFNVGRLLAAPMLIVNGFIEQQQKLSVTTAAALMSLLYLVGAVLLLAARETRGQELPD